MLTIKRSFAPAATLAPRSASSNLEMSSRASVILGSVGLLAAQVVRAGSEADQRWRQLGRMERSNEYTVVLRDHSCRVGKIANVETDSLALVSGPIIPRDDVIFIGEGWLAHDVLYSGRSSWKDVEQARPSTQESFTVVLKSGEAYRGRQLSASDSELVIRDLGHKRRFPKGAVVHVIYNRFKPVSERHKYFAREAGPLLLLDPKMWQYLLKIDAIMTVSLYDISMPEDNSTLNCSSHAR